MNPYRNQVWRMTYEPNWSDGGKCEQRDKQSCQNGLMNTSNKSPYPMVQYYEIHAEQDAETDEREEMQKGCKDTKLGTDS